MANISNGTNLLKKVKCYITVRHFFRPTILSQITRPVHVLKDRKRIGPFGWFLLAIPATTFALGTWQVQRKKWKENLIADLQARAKTDPVPLPDSIEEIAALEYYPVQVRGHFLYEKEIYMGPRSCLSHGDVSTQSSLISNPQKTGYLVVTPFKLSDRNRTILVNRGWVPKKLKNPNTRLDGEVENETNLIGVVRLQENRPNFMPSNKPESNLWFYRDVDHMAEIAGASPIFLDITDEFNVPGGPIGGQTRISLRNEHLSYILTHYSICAITSFLWYRHFLIRPK